MSEPRKWSVYFQNPEYLERTRMFLISDEMKPLVRRWCGVRDGMKLLDVGCGTGYFTRLLCEGGEKVTACGLDLEEPFVEYAKQKRRMRASISALRWGTPWNCLMRTTPSISLQAIHS